HAPRPTTPAPTPPRLYAISPAIASSDRPRVLKWTHDNAVALQEAGRRAARPLALVLADPTKRSDPAALESALVEFRYADRFITPGSRSAQLLKVFAPAVNQVPTFIRGVNDPGWRDSARPRPQASATSPPEQGGGTEQAPESGR